MAINDSNIARLDVDFGKKWNHGGSEHYEDGSVEGIHFQLFTMSLQNLDQDVQEYIFLC